MITQKEIAKRLGISRTTVARAINGSKFIKPETKEKIMALVRETNYEKNHIGSVLATKKDKIIYAFIASSKNEFYTNELKRGIEEAKKEYKNFGYKVKIISTDINKPELQIEKLKEVLDKKHIDGIIITPLDNKKVYRILKKYLDKIKIVSLGIKLNRNIYHVGPNHKNFGIIAGGIMSSLLRDNENLLVVDNGDDKISSKLYLEGFLKRIENENIIIEKLVCNGIEDSLIKMEKILKEKNIKGIYINRYAHDILDRLDKELLKDKKIVINGIGKIIKKLLKNDIITATVMNEIAVDGYEAGKIIFEKLYKDRIFENNETLSKSRIIFKENLGES